jgi:hypothetical protein
MLTYVVRAALVHRVSRKGSPLLNDPAKSVS